MMTVLTFLGPSWMIRSYSIPSSAMSQPHWYNWYCCSTRTVRQTGGWGTARGRRDWLYRLRQKFPDKPRPVTRTDHFGTLQHIIQTGRWLAYEQWKPTSNHATTIVKEYGKLFYKLLDEGVMDDWRHRPSFLAKSDRILIIKKT